MYQFAAGAIAGVTEILCLYPLGEFPSLTLYFILLRRQDMTLCADSLETGSFDTDVVSFIYLLFLPSRSDSRETDDYAIRSRRECNYKLGNPFQEQSIIMAW